MLDLVLAWTLVSCEPSSGRPITSNKDGSLQCVIRNCGTIWGDLPSGEKRWLLGTELLATQAFPVFPWLYAYPHCSYAYPRSSCLGAWNDTHHHHRQVLRYTLGQGILSII